MPPTLSTNFVLSTKSKTPGLVNSTQRINDSLPLAAIASSFGHPLDEPSRLEPEVQAIDVCRRKIGRNKTPADSLLNVLYTEHTLVSKSRQGPDLIDEKEVFANPASVYLTVKTKPLLTAVLVTGQFQFSQSYLVGTNS